MLLEYPQRQLITSLQSQLCWFPRVVKFVKKFKQINIWGYFLFLCFSAETGSVPAGIQALPRLFPACFGKKMAVEMKMECFGV